MQVKRKLACFITGLGAMSAWGAGAYPLLAQQTPSSSTLYKTSPPSGVPKTGLTPLKPSAGGLNYQLKPPVTRFPVVPGPSATPSLTSPKPVKPPVTRFPLVPGPNATPPSKELSTSPLDPSAPLPSPLGDSRPLPKTQKSRFVPLRKPVLVCRSFRRDGQIVKGFRSRLYGAKAAAIASSLKNSLSTYQGFGGNLSRCLYTGVISPAEFGKYLGAKKPSSLVRSSDGYAFPLYGSYADFLKANNGKASRFGIIAREAVWRSLSGESRPMLVLTVNNALVLFVDGRNQSSFKVAEVAMPLRLIGLSQDVAQVLSDSAKSSLRRIIDLKKIVKPNSSQSYLMPGDSGGGMTFDSSRALVASLGSFGLFTSDSSPHVGVALTALVDALHGARSLDHSNLVSQVDPQIAEYCLKAQDFSGCVETMQGKPSTPFPGQDSEAQPPSDLGGASGSPSGGQGDCPSGSYLDPDSQSCLSDEMAGGDAVVDGDPSVGDPSSDLGDQGGDPALTGGDDQGEFDTTEEMIPPGMGAPTAAACTGQTFSEQLACALLSALSGLLQQAFSK
ncbi:MAG: hypothetical protein RLZZ54_933 [Cyanobacteriota bacterium]|jgi:hypothetical protein